MSSDSIPEYARFVFIADVCKPQLPGRAFGVQNCFERAARYFVEGHVWRIPGRGLNREYHDVNPLTRLFMLEVCRPDDWRVK